MSKTKDPSKKHSDKNKSQEDISLKNETLQDESMNSPKTGKFKPITPKMGGIKEISKNVWATWTGGKPNGNWTELEEPNPKAIGPNQYQATSIVSKAKALAYRIKGLESKFTREW